MMPFYDKWTETGAWSIITALKGMARSARKWTSRSLQRLTSDMKRNVSVV